MDSVYKNRNIEILEEAPEDFYRAISVDEAKERVQKGLKKIFREKRSQEKSV